MVVGVLADSIVRYMRNVLNPKQSTLLEFSDDTKLLNTVPSIRVVKSDRSVVAGPPANPKAGASRQKGSRSDTTGCDFRVHYSTNRADWCKAAHQDYYQVLPCRTRSKIVRYTSDILCTLNLPAHSEQSFDLIDANCPDFSIVSKSSRV